jgi:UDP-N-acetylglucosamine transferase subunit ALG13
VIVVTVGMHSAPFDRLIRAADAYASTVHEQVVIQRGASRYVPLAADSFEFCDSADLERLMHESRVVVCHGADTILDALRLGRPVVAVPRRRRFREHLNDHQVHFVHALAARGWVQALDDPVALASAIESAASMKLPSVPHPPQLAGAIREQLEEWFPNTGPTSPRTAASFRASDNDAVRQNA